MQNVNFKKERNDKIDVRNDMYKKAKHKIKNTNYENNKRKI